MYTNQLTGQNEQGIGYMKKIKNSFATPLRSPQRAIEPIAKFLALSVRCSANTSHHVLYLYYINSALKLFLKSQTSKNSLAIIEILSNFAAQTTKKTKVCAVKRNQTRKYEKNNHTTIISCKQHIQFSSSHTARDAVSLRQRHHQDKRTATSRI